MRHSLIIIGGQLTIKPKLSITTAIIALAVIGIALTLTTFAALSTSTNLPSNGTIFTSANLGLYWNSACTNPANAINWGNPTPGSVTNQTVYIKNTSVGLSLTLNMTTSNWSPANSDGKITLTWNREGTELQPGQSTTATLTLTVSPNIVDITNFNVQICITGTNP